MSQAARPRPAAQPRVRPHRYPPKNSLNQLSPGMRVETTEGDLGEHDVSVPKVAKVKRDPGGNIQDVVVEKGLIFKKDVVVPAKRIVAVDPTPTPDAPEGTVMLATKTNEIDALTPTGAQALTTGARVVGDGDDSPLAELQEHIPTIEGQRRNEGARRQRQPAQSPAPPAGGQGAPGFSLKDLGPGVLAGMSGNDATAVGSYAVNGASVGFSQLWLMLLATPLYQAVVYACGKIGRVSGQGLIEVVRARFGRRVAVILAALLLLANITLIAGDLVAVGSGLELLTGLRWLWFVVPVAALLWFLTVYENFDKIKKIFLVMSFVFVVYLVTGIFSHANWGLVLHDTFVPQLGLSFTGISAAVALLGATLSPYTMFWQAESEKEQDRPGTKRQQLREMGYDTAAGAIGGNIVSYFIMLTTAATLFTHHQSINTAADAARALQPLLGPFAKYLFAVGFIGAGLIAIPVLLASCSYALAGGFGWTASLWRKPWQSEGFYLIMTGALVVSLVLALLGINPIQLIFWSNILQGGLAPIVIIVILLLGNSRRVMGKLRLGKMVNSGLALAAVISVAAVVLLIYSIVTGAS